MITKESINLEELQDLNEELLINLKLLINNFQQNIDNYTIEYIIYTCNIIAESGRDLEFNKRLINKLNADNS